MGDVILGNNELQPYLHRLGSAVIGVIETRWQSSIQWLGINEQSTHIGTNIVVGKSFKFLKYDLKRILLCKYKYLPIVKIPYVPNRIASDRDLINFSLMTLILSMEMTEN